MLSESSAPGYSSGIPQAMALALEKSTFFFFTVYSVKAPAKFITPSFKDGMIRGQSTAVFFYTFSSLRDGERNFFLDIIRKLGTKSNSFSVSWL